GRWRDSAAGNPWAAALPEKRRTTMCDEVSEILRILRQELEEILGDELDAIYLYGSRARGDARPDSDIDVLIVLRDDFDYGALIDRTSEVVSSLSLRYDVVISRTFVSQDSFR